MLFSKEVNDCDTHDVIHSDELMVDYGDLVVTGTVITFPHLHFSVGRSDLNIS